MTSPALTLVQPMQSLPSLLALGDVRRRTTAAARRSADSARLLAELLSLDPLTVLRAMRILCAPVHAPTAPPKTVAGIVDVLGTGAVVRLLSVPEVDDERTRRIRVLWQRAVARACASERLAAAAGIADPAEAYLSGLVSDLDAWMRHLGLHHNGLVPTWRGSDLVRHWSLGLSSRPHPASDFDWSDRTPIDAVRAEPDRLLDAADALAEAAGFAHPDLEPVSAVPTLPVQTAARELREEVERRFSHFFVSTGAAPERHGDPVAFGAKPTTPERASMVPRLLRCRGANDSRSLASLSVAAAIRYLDFDRAFMVAWNPNARRVWVRAKADFAKLPLLRRSIRPTDRETDALDLARSTGETTMLVRGGSSDGLCGHIASDRAIVLPVTPDQRVPSFLILDRAPSTRTIHLDQEAAVTRELGGYLTLLFDNLILRLRQRRTERNATLDGLTGLANRGVGIFTLERSIASAMRTRDPLCVMMLDLDDFKQLNDRHGHLVGDHALRLAANVLRRTVRDADTVCRYGGEEFLVILPDTHPDEATFLATRLFTEVAEAGRSAGLPLTVSIGLSSLRTGDDLDALVNRADGALYVSKSRGRNRFSADTE